MHTLAHSNPGLAPLHANRWLTHQSPCAAPHSAQEEDEKGKDLHAAAVHDCWQSDPVPEAPSTVDAIL